MVTGMTTIAERASTRRATIRRNVLLLVSYLAVMLIVARAYGS